MHWQRTFLHPMLVNFDAPARDDCTADRPLSNSPQQSLTLLNDPSFVETSLAMAEKHTLTTRRCRIGDLFDIAFLIAVARKPNERETQSLEQLYLSQREYYACHPSDAEQFLSSGNLPVNKKLETDQLAAWAQVCRVILNLHDAGRRVHECRCPDCNEQIACFGRGLDPFEADRHFTEPNDMRAQSPKPMRMIGMRRRDR